MICRRKKRALARLEAIYRSLPSANCRRLCAESCGPVVWTAIEHENIKRGGPLKTNDLKISLICPYLADGNRCSIYEYRPLLCRLFGIVKPMPCRFGCVPDRWLPDDEARKIMDEIAELWPSVTGERFPYGVMGRNRITREIAGLISKVGGV